MKKIIITMVLMCGIQIGMAQTIAGIFREFRHEDDAEYIILPKILTETLKWIQQSRQEEIEPLFDKINSMEYMDLSKSSTKVRERFVKRTKSLKMKDYEPLLITTKNGTHVRVCARMEGDVANDVVMIAAGNGSYMIFRVKGQLTMDDIKRAVERTQTS